MRIAFITYEYPPDIAKGGIATYVKIAAKVLKERGHDVEVFCGSHTRTVAEHDGGIVIHRVKTTDPATFRTQVTGVFSERHDALPFDIIESPEIHANALHIRLKYPFLKMVVRLHMALYIQMRLLNFYTTRFTRVRFFLGGLRRGKINFYGSYNYKEDPEYRLTVMSDGIASPSKALKAIISKEWHLSPSRIHVIPYPFVPDSKLLDIPASVSTKKVVTFIGKLNVHKGLVNLVKVIPMVVKKNPDVLFRLIGDDSYFSLKKSNMSNYIRKKLKGYEKNYEIMGPMEYEKVLEQLKTTAVCIFPSIWENFPLVCLEAMSAARAVIGSKEGGMSEMLAGDAGIIVDPHIITIMAESVNTLLADDDLRFRYGEAARKKVLRDYNKEVIGKQMEDYFLQITGKGNGSNNDD
jgi:glycogen(starch) synthase